MSISRKNWSALSSLTRQWTVEDEEEVEREKRRRVRGSSSTAEPTSDFSQTPSDMPATGDTSSETDSTSEMSQGISSEEQMQLDFVEMLRVRDEKRRMRHVEALRRQKESEEDEAKSCKTEGGRKSSMRRSEQLQDLEEDQDNVFSSSKPHSSPEPDSHGPPSSTRSNTNDSTPYRHHENGERRDPEPKPSSNQTRKFVSFVSISLDMGPTTSGRTTPISPCPSTSPLSPREHWQSPSPEGAQSPKGYGHAQENGSSSGDNDAQKTKPAFVRQSSRTVSFRMMKKKEEESAPLQRSASVRIASKKFESNTNQSEDENKPSAFQRNSRQRISSRSIQETMERLAQASQKSEMMRFPDVAQRTLCLMDEVSRKRGLFEKEQQPVNPTSPGVSKQEFGSFTSGMTDRINRWRNKANRSVSSHSPVDLRHVDINSKRSLFERSGEDHVPKTK